MACDIDGATTTLFNESALAGSSHSDYCNDHIVLAVGNLLKVVHESYARLYLKFVNLEDKSSPWGVGDAGGTDMIIDKLFSQEEEGMIIRQCQ